jgi:hypothetical protein
MPGSSPLSTVTSPLLETAVVDDTNNDHDQARQTSSSFVSVAYADITKYFTVLGWTAFGGPQAHVGMFETVCLPHTEQEFASLLPIPSAAFSWLTYG